MLVTVNSAMLKDSCGSLGPGHGKQPNNPVPYKIIPSSRGYEDGQKIGVEIAGEAYQGIMMQARLADGSSHTPQGTFSSPGDGFHTMKCTKSDDTISHSNSFNKHGLMHWWNPPKSDVGPIHLIALIYTDEDHYYRDVTSANLSWGMFTTNNTGSEGTSGNDWVSSGSESTCPLCTGLLVIICTSLIFRIVNNVKAAV